MSLRIAMFASNYPPHPGGLEIAVQKLAAGLARRHDVTVVTTAWQGNAGIRTEGDLEVLRLPTFHATERAGVPYPVPIGLGLRRAMSVIANADVVHAHGALYPTTVLAAWAARRKARPFILTEHVGFVPYANNILNTVQRGAWRQVGDRVVSSARTVVTYNARVAAWLRDRYRQADVQFIENGVDQETFRPRPASERAAARRSLGLPADEILALFVGRHSEKKNLDAVLRVPRGDCTLVVCGANRGLGGDRVIDLGVLPHHRMPELYGCADVMINVSTGEGFPLAVQEALACGLPVILLWDPGYGDSLERDVLLAIDHLDELPSSLNSLVRDAHKRSVLSARGREWAVRRWDWTNTAEGYERVYQRAIHDQSAGIHRSAEHARTTAS